MLRLNNSFVYNNINIKLNLLFERVLLFFDLVDDNNFDDCEKIEIGFNLLCKNTESSLTIDDKNEIIKIISKEYLDFLPINSCNDNDSGSKSFDFMKDFPFLYASFVKDYGIDLYDEFERMDWRKFISLFHGLSDDTVIKKIINIRTKKVPKLTKDNKEYVESLIKTKNLYRLEVPKEKREENFKKSILDFAKKFM